MTLFPTSPGPSKFTLRSLTNVREDLTHNMKRQRRASDVQRFLAIVRYDLLTRAQYNDMWGFLIQEQVRFRRFDFQLPSPYDAPEGTGGGTPVVNGASQTGRTLITDGWTVSSAVLKVGDLFQLTNHLKIYTVTADGTSDGSGDLTINFEPPLLQSPADGETIKVSTIAMQVSLLNPQDLVTPERNKPFFEDVEFSLIEDV